jgi:hypothetical protein
LWPTAEVALGGKFIALNAYIRKEDISQPGLPAKECREKRK